MATFFRSSSCSPSCVSESISGSEELPPPPLGPAPPDVAEGYVEVGPSATPRPLPAKSSTRASEFFDVYLRRV